MRGHMNSSMPSLQSSTPSQRWAWVTMLPSRRSNFPLRWHALVLLWLASQPASINVATKRIVMVIFVLAVVFFFSSKNM